MCSLPAQNQGGGQRGSLCMAATNDGGLRVAIRLCIVGALTDRVICNFSSNEHSFTKARFRTLYHPPVALRT
jgi:hypothetical protein